MNDHNVERRAGPCHAETSPEPELNLTRYSAGILLQQDIVGNEGQGV